MQVFGITINKITLPIIYLACSIVGYLLLRESLHIFQHSIAIRAITAFLELGFIFLSLPALYNMKTFNLSPKICALIILWLFFSFLSTLTGNQPWPAMVRWFEVLTSISAGLCLYLLINIAPELKLLIVRSIIIALLLCVFVFISYWHISLDPEKHNWVSDIPFFLNIRHFSYLAAAALPLGYWLLENERCNNKKIATIYLSICWGLIFWLGGRAAFIGTVVVTILYLILSRENLKLVLSSILTGVLLSQLFITDSSSLNMFRLLDLFINSEDKDINSHTSYRMEIYLESIHYWWREVPFLGNGADGYRYIIPAIADMDNITHPHSIAIQLLLSYGIIGLLIPSYLFLVLTHSIFTKHANLKTIDKALYLSVLSSVISGIFNGILYHAYGLFITTIILAICIPNYPQKRVLNSKKIIPTSIMILTLISCLYFLVFSTQLYTSKTGCANKNWIDWNANFPLYFSPTWNYSRYSKDDIPNLKKIHHKNSINKSCI